VVVTSPARRLDRATPKETVMFDSTLDQVWRRRATRSALAALSAAAALSLVACAGSKPGGSDDPDAGDDDSERPDGRRPPPGPPDAPFVCDSANLGAVTFERIATWRDDAKGAYAMIHDDMCGPGLEGIQDLAVPALAARGLRAGLGPFVDACEENNRWDVVREAESLGMEIINHSYSHPEITPANAAKEVAQAKAAFDKQLENPITFYIFPYDFFTAETIAAVGTAGHLGARAGNRDPFNGADKPPINPAEPGGDLTLTFDVWPRNYSKYARYAAEDMLWVHAVNAVEKGGFAIREFHSVMEDNEQMPEVRGFGPIKISEYERHLDDLVAARNAGQLWTDNPSTILKYRQARVACGASVDGDTIVFDDSDADCKKYATPISVIVRVDSELRGLNATQDGAQVPTWRLEDGVFSVTADPTKGDVVLSGCGNDSPGVSSEAVRARPQPAASVCDLEKVVGAGADGQMDDLERPIEQFQVLPNPSQRDGRTGSWSWYPQQARVAMAADGGSNTVLSYSGTSLNAWTGVTLAFLGGNGAGSCYDAARYTGIRFRIKGTAVAPGDAALNGKVNVSLVTAETQTANYGGDLNGEGGHFHKLVTLTPGWTTVELPFAMFDKPTWGDTMSLTALAKGKLQAIDWGVSNMATSFDISIDDIELY
jgi:hypothetical protein